MAEDDERRLLDRCLAGNEDACAALVDGYARMAGTVIWRATGDQDLRGSRAGNLPSRLSRAAVLRPPREAVHVDLHDRAPCGDRPSAKGRRWQEQSFAVAEDEPAAAVDLLPAPALVRPDTLLARSEDVRLVRAALARLPDKYRVPLVYAAIDELDYPTIADMLGVTVGAVKTLVFRGKRMLKDGSAVRDNEIDDALRGQPVWEPPPGFARRVVRLSRTSRLDVAPVTLRNALRPPAVVRVRPGDGCRDDARGIRLDAPRYWLLLAR